MFKWFALVAAFVLLLSGCAGGGYNGGNFQGAYAGTWTDPITNATGNINFTIDSAAHLEGSITNTTYGAGIITGNIKADGDLNSKINFASKTAGLNGLAATTAGGLSGTLTISVSGSKNVTINFQTTGGTSVTTSPFQGTFVGNWTNPLTSQKGSIQLSIDSQGDTAGTITATTQGAGTIGGNITTGGTLTTSVIFPAASATLDGSVQGSPSTGAFTSISGTLTLTPTGGAAATINFEATAEAAQ